MVCGVRESATFNNIVTVLNVIVLAFAVVLGSFHCSTENWSPFAPFGIPGIFKGAGIIFFSYIGFDMVSSLAEEAKSPQRDMVRDG